jgi:hypothetical protein
MIVLLAGSASAQQIPAGCASWGAAVEIGALDHEVIEEASGLDFSERHHGRIYHIADGDDSRLYVTDRRGVIEREVAISGFEGTDVEDLSVARCADGSWCIFVADIGDNGAERESLEVVVLRESDDFGDTIEPLDRVRYTYPDGPHDAEAFAVHPGGDFFVVTRKFSLIRRTMSPSQIFRLRREQWQSHGGEVLMAEPVGTLDLRRMAAGPFPGGVPTAMDIVPEGDRVLILTDMEAYELRLDLATAAPVAVAELAASELWSRVDLVPLEQQEAAAWVPGGRSFVYGTEYNTRFPLGGRSSGRARLMRVDCEAGR